MDGGGVVDEIEQMANTMADCGICCAQAASHNNLLNALASIASVDQEKALYVMVMIFWPNHVAHAAKLTAPITEEEAVAELEEFEWIRSALSQIEGVDALQGAMFVVNSLKGFGPELENVVFDFEGRFLLRLTSGAWQVLDSKDEVFRVLEGGDV